MPWRDAVLINPAAPVQPKTTFSSRPITFVSPFLATLTDSSHQYHSKNFTCHLFSYSYALFDIAKIRIILVFNSLRTLSGKYRGGGWVPRPPEDLPPALTLLRHCTYTHCSVSFEAPCS